MRVVDELEALKLLAVRGEIDEQPLAMSGARMGQRHDVMQNGRDPEANPASVAERLIKRYRSVFGEMTLEMRRLGDQ